MTLPIARDLADKQIRVMTIAPGLFDTPLLAGSAGTGQGLARSAGAASVAAGQPQRIRRPWPYTSENPMLNGEVIQPSTAPSEWRRGSPD